MRNLVRASLALALLLTAVPPLRGQDGTTPQPTPQKAAPQPSPATDTDEVVRITTNLVQIDAVVTDKDGRQVTDLRPEDFEVLENGRPQRVTDLSYVAVRPAGASAVEPVRRGKPAPADPLAPPAPSPPPRPDQVRRRVVLVVDDVGMAFDSAHFVRRALRKFVDEQMQPGDEVALFRTRGGIGMLQQFTTDRRLLHTAINMVRAYGFGRTSFAGTADGAFGNDVDDLTRDHQTVGMLGTLNQLVRGLKDLPGRKAIVLMTDRLPIFGDEGRNQQIVSALDRLVDAANRASTVIHTIDTRGLETLNFTAADGGGFLGAGGNWAGVRPMSPGSDVMVAPNLQGIAGRSHLSALRNDSFRSKEGMEYLARRTGGTFTHNSNDVFGGVKRALEEQSGYYLIAYRPEESTFDPRTGARRFHKVEVKVKRSGLRVRARGGFIGVTDEELKRRPATRQQQYLSAYASLFAASGVGLRLTSLFTDDPQTGPAMRSLLNVDARDLTFSGADSWDEAASSGSSQHAFVDLLATTFDGEGRVVEQVENRARIEVRGDSLEHVRREGVEYVLNVPIKKPGAYQLRIAVRDATSGKVGSASQLIEVPNLKKNRLALSGIVLRGSDWPNASPLSQPAARARSNPSDAEVEDDAAAEDLSLNHSPSVRRFGRRVMLDYGYVVYNAQLDPATRQPRVKTQLRLFREGRQVYEGTPAPLDLQGQTNPKRLLAGGRLRLGEAMEPGHYVLQVVVWDELAKEKQRIATQWMDFELLR